MASPSVEATNQLVGGKKGDHVIPFLLERSLTIDECRDRLYVHFTELSSDDRILRFCSGLSDEGIAQYVNRIRSTDTIIAASIDSRIIGACHLAPTRPGRVELGLSVNEGYRGRGIASKLFQEAIARPDVGGVILHCLPHNLGMKRIALQAGCTMEVVDGEVTAWVEK